MALEHKDRCIKVAVSCRFLHNIGFLVQRHMYIHLWLLVTCISGLWGRFFIKYAFFSICENDCLKCFFNREVRWLSDGIEK